MRNKLTAAMIGLGTLALGACTGFGDDYGYGRASVSYSSHGGYYEPFRDDYGYGHGYRAALRYGIPVYYGWYDNFYYPGYGVHVFDRRGQRFGWRAHHRRYWYARHHEFRSWRDRNPRYDLARIDRRIDRLERRADRQRDRRFDRYENRRERIAGEERRDSRWDRRDDRGEWRDERRDQRADRRDERRDDRRGERRRDGSADGVGVGVGVRDGRPVDAANGIRARGDI
ncbi:MAG: hypothetical protein V2J26_12450, partial [Pacificimonas sp.]|nr:hypothetical protein [Pacificimonas sp.]